jgi:uncharacterized delta-60 repeat protein
LIDNVILLQVCHQHATAQFARLHIDALQKQPKAKFPFTPQREMITNFGVQTATPDPFKAHFSKMFSFQSRWKEVKIADMKAPGILRLVFLMLILLTLKIAYAGPGGWDQTYAPTVSNGPVYAMALQPNGELVIGGAFTAVDGSSSSVRLARLFSNGTLDATFFPTGSGVSGTVLALAVQTDGSIVIGGDFTSINGTARNRIARLNSNGTADGSFLPTNSIDGSVLALAVQTNNAVIIGGSFAQGPFPSWNARLNADGSTDTSFSSIPNGAVYAIAIQTDGKIVIGGAFTTVDGANRYRIARLNPDGSLDNTFQNGMTGASSNVRCIQIQTDGKILIGGDFTTVNGAYRNYVARLNSDGSIDAGFTSSPGANGSIYAVAEQPDNSVVIGGNFTSYNEVSLSRVARLYADGTRDTTFTNFGINETIQALAIQSDGGILIGGLFTTINNAKWSYLGRLYGDLYPPQFVEQPASLNTNVGTTATFSAQVSNPTATTFQWRLNGNDIPGATDTSYSLYNVQLSDAGNYSVFVNDADGGTTSSNAVLQVGYTPVVVQQPLSLTNFLGGTANFSCQVTGSAPINLQWTLFGNPLTGATNTTLTITNLQPGNIGYYALTATNIFGGTVSSNAALNLAGYGFGVWDGLVAYYPFNGNANDWSGNGNNGTVIGATLIPDRFGIPNAAYSFDGVSDIITVPDFPGADANAHTMSIWMQANSWTNIPSPNPYVDIFGKDNGVSGTRQWVCQGLQTGQIKWAVFTSTGEYDLVSASQLQTGQWYQVVTVWDGTNESVFINGTFDSSIPAPGTLVQGSAPVRIGGNPDDAQQFFGGNLDDVRIYNRALSSNEVATLYTLESQSNLQPPLTLTATLGAGPVFNLNLNSIPGQNYVLQTATNLLPPIQWLPVLTNAVDTNGLWQFADTNLNSAQKFYRITTP